jgi:hypothetical protein
MNEIDRLIRISACVDVSLVSLVSCASSEKVSKKAETHSTFITLPESYLVALTAESSCRYANEKVNKMLVGNKCDLVSKKVVNTDDFINDDK